MISDPKIAESVNEAFRRYYEEEYQQASDICLRILNDFPETYDILYLQGLILARMGEEGAAEDYIGRARRGHPPLTQFDFTTQLLERYGNVQKGAIWEYRLEEFQKHQIIKNYVLSYPKCGRTWVRFVLGSYSRTGDGPKNLADSFEVAQITAAKPEFPTTEFSHDDLPMTRSLGELITDKSIYRDKKVVFLVRDPRDVIVSFYFQYTRRGRIWDLGQERFEGDLSAFIRQDAGGIGSLVGFFNIWATERSVPKDFLLIRYEDLMADPEAQYFNLVKFLEWPWLGKDALKGAVDAGRFDRMHNMEQAGTFEGVRVGNRFNDDPEAFKTRRGVIGGYADYLTQADIDYIDSYLDRHLDDSYDYYKR